MPSPLLCPPELLQVDLGGTTYIVTGGNAGIGRVTVGQLARQGARVILACRRLEAGEQARRELMARGMKGSIEVAVIDLADLASVRAFAQAFLDSGSPLQGLVNNAGVMNTPAGKTKDGFETQFGTNHLGHYLMTELLLPALEKGAPSRIVNVSSCFHDKAYGREGRIDFEDPNFERRKYDGWTAYAQSKLANVLHARQLAKRMAGKGVTALSLHPGWVRTNLIGHTLPLWVQNVLLRPVFKLSGMLEPWEGTQSTLYTLLAPRLEMHAGAYFSQVGLYRTKQAQLGGWPMSSPNPEVNDANADRLEALSRRLLGMA